MHWLDRLFVALPLGIMLCVGIYAQRFMRNIADFMSGSRLVGYYLLLAASRELQAGQWSSWRHSSASATPALH